MQSEISMFVAFTAHQFSVVGDGKFKNAEEQRNVCALSTPH